MSDWVRPIEQLVLSGSLGRRIVGVTAPHAGAGVSTVANAFAEICGRWGSKTLLVDLSQAAVETTQTRRWAPGLGDPKMFLEITGLSYDVLQAVCTSAKLGLLNSARDLRSSLIADLASYQSIVLDLRSVLDYTEDTINPLVTAIACDGLIVVCAKGTTTADQLRRTVDAISLTGVPMIGTILNDLGKQKGRAGRSGPRAS